MHYFDVEAKEWKPLASLAPTSEVTGCFCSEVVGSKVFVGGRECGSDVGGWPIYCYDVERNVWSRLADSRGLTRSSLCTVGDYMYAVPHDDLRTQPQRYSLVECHWQRVAKVNINFIDKREDYCNSGATVLHSKVYVLYGIKKEQKSVLHSFDPLKNEKLEKATTCHPHYESILFVVNNKLCVAGGRFSDLERKKLGHPAAIEFYDEDSNTWSVVDENHIPPNNLGVVEIEGKVYFIINKFPIDSGIRIPQGEVYPVRLDDWQNLTTVKPTAVLCYLAVKWETFKVD